jgi:hypothetical protein
MASLRPSATGSRMANPRPPGGPPSAWMEMAALAWTWLPIAARSVTHGPTPVFAGAGERDRRSFRAEVGGKVHGDVPVELGLGVAAAGLRTGGVAGFGFPAIPDQLADDRGGGEVPAVVARVHGDHLATENPGAGRAEQFRAAAGGVLLRLRRSGLVTRRRSRRPERPRRAAPTRSGASESRTRIDRLPVARRHGVPDGHEGILSGGRRAGDVHGRGVTRVLAGV